jgi:hypothetical protein
MHIYELIIYLKWQPIEGLLFWASLIGIFILMVILSSIDSAFKKNKEKRAERRGIKQSVIYELSDGTELFISYSWLLEDAKETVEQIKKNYSSLFNHKQFQKLTGEKFSPDRLLIKSYYQDSLAQLFYSDSGIKDSSGNILDFNLYKKERAKKSVKEDLDRLIESLKSYE